jgi:hypothetical protein
MLLAAGLPKTLWGHAMQHAAFLDGYLGGSDGRQAPNTLWYGHIDEPELRVFGSSVVYTPHVSKKPQMDPTGLKGYFVGYPPHMDGILVYDPSKSTMPVRATRNYQNRSWNEEIAVITEPIGVSADTYELLADEISQLEQTHMQCDHEAIPLEEANVPADVKSYWQELQTFASTRRRQLHEKGVSAHEAQKTVRGEWTQKQRAEAERKAQQRLTAENIEVLQETMCPKPNKKTKLTKEQDAGTETDKSEATTMPRRKTPAKDTHEKEKDKYDKTKDKCASCNGWESNQTDKMMLQCDKCDVF